MNINIVQNFGHVQHVMIYRPNLYNLQTRKKTCNVTVTKSLN